MSELEFRDIRLSVPGLEREYKFLHITDSHLVLYDETETPERAAYADPRKGWFTHDGIPAEDTLIQDIDWANDHADELDGVFFTGDIIDFPSPPNIKALTDALGRLRVSYFYTLGNHDWAYYNDYHTPHAIVANRPHFGKLCGGNTYAHKMRFGELTVIGLDNTMEMYEDGVAETLEELLEGEKNVLILQHIPLYADTLHKDTVSYWHGQDINIGGMGICKNDNWRRIIDIVSASDSPVRAFVTGHLHFDHYDILGCGIPQIVTAAGCYGKATLITISE